uniref:NB-ARC domain-containing protein n=1 Tax=Oryza nivara TaxID=4536 RepID=A0A0E0H343_ORYNI
MARCGGERMVDELRDVLDDFAFRAKRLAAPLLQPFGRASEAVALDGAEIDGLRRIRAALRAAEERVVTDDFVRLWLRELEDLERMAEDVLEELEFEALRASRLERFKLQLLRSSAGKRKRELSSLFSSSPDRLNRKIGKIMERYNDLARDRDALRLRSSDGERRREPSPLTPTSCLTKCSLHEESGTRSRSLSCSYLMNITARVSYSVVPIVGAAGVGKTSLVQHIYNDEALRSKFDMKMWVWVCQEFDVLKLTRKLAEEATESPCGFAEMNQLHRIIAKRLEGKRFLLVLDDVWDESLVRWTSLLVPLKSAAPGSRIVVTTRSAKVARMMAFKIHQLGYLTDTTCWSVCRDAALQDRDPSKSVAAKCKGLPLAANAAGSVLSIAIDRKHWETVEQSDLWANNEVIDHTLPALLVSYNSLQKPLKHCFSYCSLFPKEYVFRKDKLVRLWLAQGFAAADGESDAEDIACRYFHNLVERFFLQQSPSYDHNEQRYVMHDLYHELAEYVAADEYSRIERFTLSSVNGEARHLSLTPSETHSHEIGEFHASNNKYMNESQYPGLRTLLVVQRTKHYDGRKTSSIQKPSVLFKAFVCLRALDLSNTDMEGLPNSIGELIHLRYLSLENTKIKCLPESISSLFKLHTMNLKCCNYLSELPQGIKFLANLRHLELPRIDNWNVYMPCGISELTNLQTMHTIKFTSDSGSCGIADLVNLDNLRGELCISGIENVSKEQIATEAIMKNKGELRKLVLQWSHNDSMFANDASSVLDSLQPHPALEELIIMGFFGVKFPVWMGSQCSFKLSFLELKDCRNCKELPSLGLLPCLKHLFINSLTSIKHVRWMLSSGDHTSSGDFQSRIAFPTLETLKFTDMESWEHWDETEATDFPCLRHLTILNCSKLTGLPKLLALVDLRIKNCECLLDLPSFPSLQCIKMEGCEVLPFQNPSVQDSQKTWTFLRCAGQILECNVVACTDLTFGQTNVHSSEEEIGNGVIFHIGQDEAVELVSCKPVWVQIGQPEEVEIICID